MLLENKKVAIVGGGPGGLTLARLLQQKGVDVIVYERDRDKYARVQGAPLDLHDDSGLAALRKGGLLEAFKENFLPGADRMRILNERAEILFSDHESKSLEKFGDAHFRPEINRGALRKILLESLQPGTVVWDSHFASMEKQGKGWLMNFNNQESVYADFVVAADGANSKLRPYLTDIKPFYSGITMLEGNIPDATRTAPRIAALLRGGKIMAFGKHQDILMGQKGSGEIGFYASFRADEQWAAKCGVNFSERAQILAWFQQEYSGWNSIWDELFEKAETPFVPRPIYCMPLDQNWEAQPTVTMIGDAAHVMPPFAGEGVNMAMLDALELSECLTANQFDTLEDAVSAYESNMRKRASRAAQESLENGERMHSDDALETMLGFFNGH